MAAAARSGVGNTGTPGQLSSVPISVSATGTPVELDGSEQRPDLVEPIAPVDVDAHDDAGVDLAGPADGLDDRGQLVGGDARAEVDRVGGRRCGRHQPGDLVLQPRRQHRHVEAAGVGGVGAEDQRTAGVADERDPAPGRRRLTVEQQPDVDQLLQRARPAARRCGRTARRRRPGRWRGRRCAHRAPPPGAVRPLFRATTGLRWDTARATRAKRTGSPNDSR